MVSLRGLALGPLISLLETPSAISSLHLDTIRPGPRQSGQDPGSLPGDHPSTEWNACERSGVWAIVDCNQSVISGPDDWPSRKSEIISEMAKGERKEGGEPLASGKHSSGNENCSSCQYPPNPDRRPARLEFLVTYVDSHFGIS